MQAEPLSISMSIIQAFVWVRERNKVIRKTETGSVYWPETRERRGRWWATKASLWCRGDAGSGATGPAATSTARRPGRARLVTCLNQRCCCTIQKVRELPKQPRPLRGLWHPGPSRGLDKGSRFNMAAGIWWPSPMTGSLHVTTTLTAFLPSCLLW